MNWDKAERLLKVIVGWLQQYRIEIQLLLNV